MKIKYFTVFFLSGIFLVISARTYSHDTTHIHPLITLEIAKLIRNIDDVALGGNSAYADLYLLNPDPIINPLLPNENQFLYWGTDFDPAATLTKDYLLKDQFDSYIKNNNVIDGVVYEDIPTIPGSPIPDKVRHHFYQANTGIPLTISNVPLGSDSATRAMTFFNQAVEVMSGYSDRAKAEAFFLFGQSLHHVEDMTSPAHIHNDAHLTFLETEKDDYEGWWLPQQKIVCGANLDAVGCNYFTAANTVSPVSDPWQDIWGTSGFSLVRNIHRATTYNATLQYKFSVFEEIANSFEYYTNATIAPDPVGELQEMFPCTNGMNNPNCLYWNEDAPDAPAHWTITGVGDFQHQVSVVDENSWWPIELETSNAIGEGAVYQDTYYIEQLALNNTSDFPEGDKLTPAKIRSNLMNTNWQGNMVINTQPAIPLMEKYARTFLAPAVTYGAGFTQYWYDIANTPPFLKSVKVEQEPVVGDTPVVKYAATWVDQEDADTKMVDSRVFSRTTVQTHIHDEKALTLTLTFNEPIKQITQLRLGAFNAAGGCALPEQGCVDITEVTNINDAMVKSLMITRV